MTARIRSPRRSYKLLIDPEHLDIQDTIDGWILDLLVKAGGRMSRKEMTERFTKLLRRRRPDLNMRPTSVLSVHQRRLRDMGIIAVFDEHGRPIPTRVRSSLVKV